MNTLKRKPTKGWTPQVEKAAKRAALVLERIAANLTELEREVVEELQYALASPSLPTNLVIEYAVKTALSRQREEIVKVILEALGETK